MRIFAVVICLLLLGSCTQAARYDVIDLGALEGMRESRANDINNSGVVVGFITDNKGTQHAFLYDGQMWDLGTLEGHTTSHAFGINDFGAVVGHSYEAQAAKRAFLYEKGVIHDLNTLINPEPFFTLEDAQAINNAGQIAGYGKDAQGQEHAFLLIPVSR